MTDRKRLSMTIDADLAPWCDYAAGLAGQSVTAYINAAIRRDRDAASDAVRDGYKAFETARAETANK